MKASIHHRDTEARSNAKRLSLLLCLCVAMLILSGCFLRGKPKTAVAPPPPAASAPAAGPISIPQTQVQLPPPQPVNPEALETAKTPQEPSTPPPAPATRPQRRTPQPAPQPKLEAPAAPAPVAPPEPPRAPIHEIVPPIEQKRLQDSAQAHKREIQRLVAQARTQRLTKQDRTLVDLILSFVKLSDEAERRGDMRQADELANRGLVLAKELPGGK